MIRNELFEAGVSIALILLVYSAIRNFRVDALNGFFESNVNK